MTMAHLLVVDDEPSARSTLALLLRKRGHRVLEADGLTSATARLSEEVFDLVVTDLRMPDGDGLDVLRAAKTHAPATEVILLTAYAEWKSAKEAIRLGALDYFEKGQEPDELYHRIDKALAGRALRQENENLRRQLRERYGLPGLIAQSSAMQSVLELVERVAPTDATLLIRGESGTGKEVIAKAVHHASPRASRPFVAVNCGAVPETLLESELFGYMRGAFTGAAVSKLGLFEEAGGGTLFLDEIAEMPAALQVKLLRALQSGEVRRLGATQSTIIDVRVIAATHGDLSALLAQGTFREDLFYRLNVIHIVVPPLRDRREDIPLLVDHFLARFHEANRSPIAAISPVAMKALTDYSWPGNVRELENVIERLVVTVQRSTIELEDLSSEIKVHDPVALRPKRERRRTVADDLYKRLVEQKESFWTTVYPLFMDREITRANVREVVRRGLEEARGNYKIVARLFNMEPREYKRFLNFLRKHDCQIPFKDYR
jgi:DNA-binding NtrC family response regulator